MANPTFEQLMDAILNGEGNMSTEDGTVRDQLDRYLSRMRFALPFPVSSDDCYFGCMPPSIKAIGQAGAFKQMPTPSRNSNLMLTMHQSGQSINRVRNILHISVDPKEAYMRAVTGHAGYERVFWIEVHETLPTPRNSMQNPFFFPPDHPQANAILDWVNKAYAIEHEIEQSIKWIEELTKAGMSPAIAAKVWPELANFLNFRKGLPNNVTNAVRDRAAKAVPQDVRDQITTQLARAVMLPDAEGKRQAAWVRFYTRDTP